MRFRRAGSIFLGLFTCLCLASLARAQAEGEVESIGFGGYYRTNCWTPMKLRLRPKIGQPATYKIQVIQDDIDRDRVHYSRPFTLGGNTEGGRTEERVWVYFIPDPAEPRSRNINDSLKVFLCTPDGKQLVRLPVAGLPPLSEPDVSRSFWNMRTSKLILLVGDSNSRPLTDVFTGARGITEDVIFQRVSLSELPSNVNGYEAVDGIVWMNADPQGLTGDTTTAIEDYVRDGGKLVVTQNAQNWQRVTTSDWLGPMLPVEVTGVINEINLASLRRLTPLPNEIGEGPLFWRAPDGAGGNVPLDPWADKQDKDAPIAIATPKRGARVNLWSAANKNSPYLCRWVYGLGSVIWVAQDFGDPTVVSTSPLRSLGWAEIWTKVFDWQYVPYTRLMLGDTYASNQQVPRWIGHFRDEEAKAGYGRNASATDISTAMLDKMNPGSTGAMLIGLAIVFFIAYWLVAGPGSYFFLLAKKQSHLSWFAYAICALAATGITVLMVQLVLRGPPVMQHVTMQRVGPEMQAVTRSQFGLYVKQDGDVEVKLRETLPKRSSYVTPYPMHWTHLPQNAASFLGNKEYEVPMRDRNSADDPAVSVPFRSTLKKFQSKWVGKANTIDGQVTFADGLTGTLVNNTGSDLYDVHLIYNQGVDQNGLAIDYMIHIPDPRERAGWPKGASINIADVTGQNRTRALTGNTTGLPNLEGDDLAYRGTLHAGWEPILNTSFGGGFSDNNRFGDLDRAALLLSIYDRLRPSRPKNPNNPSDTRFELLRYANRSWDASHVIASGHMLVFARTSPSGQTGPLPFPLEVDGRKTEGNGSTFCQFVVPLTRTGGAATQPTVPDTNTTETASIASGIPQLATGN